MSTPTVLAKPSPAFSLQAAIAFGISFLATLGGIYFLPLDGWQRGFLFMAVLFLVTSCFTLAKVVRDQQEASTVRVRLDEARMDKLLAEHDPFKIAA